MSSDFQFATEFTGEPGEDEVVGYRLGNGLRVVMLKRHRVPVVAVDLWYLVGSKNEQPGKSGFAHLFEHMMFEGSAHVGKAQHIKFINDVGGMVNASTSQDRTNYWEVVPANQLRLALWLEADRMKSLKLTEENFQNQRSTVKEERRLRVDNQPYMRVLYELKDEVAYQRFPYAHSVIGSMEDLDRATLSDARHFHDTYYRPNNTILAIAGDFQVKEALAIVREYFEEIPAGPPVPSVDLTEPPQQKEKRVNYQDPFAPYPAYLVSYHIPERSHPDFYPLGILDRVLLDGESSRLYRHLVEEKQMVLHLTGGWDGKLGPALFYIFAQLRPGYTFAQLETLLDQEMKAVIDHPLSEAEIRKAKNKILAEHYSQLETVRQIADQLCFYTTLFGNPELIYQEVERFRQVTVRDVRRVARQYFRKENRSVILIHPNTGG